MFRQFQIIRGGLRFMAVVLALAVHLVFAAQAFAQGGIDTGNVNQQATGSYMGTMSQEKFDITFRQASLREALQFLSWISELNIVIPEGLDGVVNLSFKDIAISDALNSIIKANSLEYTVEGRILRIGKSDQFRDSGEDLRTETFRLRYAGAKDMVEKVKSLLSSRGSAIGDDRTNSLIVREIPANIDNVRRFVDDVDIKDAQVLIESKIMEATRSFSRDLGIQWGMTKGGATSKLAVAGLNAVGQDDQGRNLNVNLSPSTPTSGIFIGSFFKGMNLDFQVLAAEQRGDVYVISDPSIVTSNGKSANIRSGATLLIQSASTVNIGTTGGQTASANNGVQQIETGIQLTVTPQITINDYVKLDIKTLSSTPDFSRQVQGMPVIIDNTATTVVLVKDGETTIIGGLSRYSDTLTRKKVPYLAEIPLLGNLFKSKSRQKENTELLVFIKPSIIRSEGTAPAQMRVREMEERRADTYLEPIIDPQKDAEVKAERAEKKKENEEKRKGNKYIQ